MQQVQVSKNIDTHKLWIENIQTILFYNNIYVLQVIQKEVQATITKFRTKGKSMYSK